MTYSDFEYRRTWLPICTLSNRVNRWKAILKLVLIVRFSFIHFNFICFINWRLMFTKQFVGNIYSVPKKNTVPLQSSIIQRWLDRFKWFIFYFEVCSFLLPTIFLLTIFRKKYNNNKIFSASGHFKMHRKTLLISLRYLRTLILKL